LFKRYKIVLNYIAGPLLFIWLSLSIYHQVVAQKNLMDSWRNIVKQFSFSEYLNIFFVFLLMPLNWTFEAMKWRLLVEKIQHLSLIQSLKSVFAGQAFSMNTFNGAGEFLGKLLFLKADNRIRAISISFLGSLSQLIITFLAGFSSLCYMWNIRDFNEQVFKKLSVYWSFFLIPILVICNVFFLLLYYRAKKIKDLLKKIRLIRKYTGFFDELENFDWKELTAILILSLLRFIVFVSQYVILFRVFKVDADWFLLSCLICIMFLFLAIIPGITLAELGIRGELSILLIGLVSKNTIGILLCASGIWLINKLLPAIIGTVFVIGIRVFKKPIE